MRRFSLFHGNSTRRVDEFDATYIGTHTFPSEENKKTEYSKDRCGISGYCGLRRLLWLAPAMRLLNRATKLTIWDNKRSDDNFGMVMGLNKQGWTQNMDGTKTRPSFRLSTAILSGRAVMNIDGHNIDLGTLGGKNSWTNYGGINDRGENVGLAETSVPDPDGEDICAFGTKLTCRGFLWRHGQMKALPTLGGNNGQAAAINNRGQIVGISETAVQDPGCPPARLQRRYRRYYGKKAKPGLFLHWLATRRLRTRHQRWRPSRRLVGNLHQHIDARRIVGKRHCHPASRPRSWKGRLRHE